MSSGEETPHRHGANGYTTRIIMKPRSGDVLEKICDDDGVIFAELRITKPE